MTKVIFENDTGRLCFSGGGRNLWRITNISGLGMSGKNFQTVSYFAEAGQKTINEKRASRIITIACDICGEKYKITKGISEAIKILDGAGWLTVRSNGFVRKIKARCTEFLEGENYGTLRKFTLQFCCDCPYFEDVGNDSIALFEKTKEIKNTFTFPKILTSRKSGGVVINRGDVEAEPLFDIYFGSETPADSEITLTIFNETTNKKLIMLLNPIPGDLVKVDISKRTICNNEGENLITSLSDDCSLSNFVLKKGANTINITSDVEANFSVVCIFTNRYLEAVC